MPSSGSAHALRGARAGSWTWTCSSATWSTGTRTYHHTAPVNALYGLHESLLLLHEEGLEAAWARHRRNHEALVAGFEAMGLRQLVAPADRLPQLNMVVVPEGIDEATVRQRLLSEFDVEVGAGLGALSGKVWRVGLMGATCNEASVLRCLDAYESVLSDLGFAPASGAGRRAARESLTSSTAS